MDLVDRSPEADRGSRPFALFAASFALALLAHQLWWRGFELLDPHALVVAAAAVVLLRPSSPGRLAALAAVETAVVAGDLPSIGDHTLLALVTSVCLLAVLVPGLARRRRLPDASALWTALAPFLRVEAVVLYAAAGLAKLNSGFLDPATSCAAGLSRQVAFFDPSLLDGAWRVVPAIAGTIAVELGLAVLLVLPRTRAAGVVLGAAFHGVLALAGNVPFAALALALYVAFLPSGARLPAWRPSRPAAAALVLAAAAAWLGLAVAEAADPDVVRNATRDLARVLVAGWAAALALLALRGRHAAGRGGAGSVRRLRPALVAGAALLVLNAASPYLGLKTEGSFAMYSNLQTEPGHWNHVLVPEAVRVFGLQDDLVRIIATNAPGLERRRRAGLLMVRHELERFLRERPGTWATYADADRLLRWRTASAATLPGRPVLDRVLNFLDVSQGAAQRC